MTYTPVTSVRGGDINLRACVNEPFITQHAYIPQRGWNAGQVKLTSPTPITSTISGYINYINDGTNESLKTDLVNPDQAQWGGHYTGNVFMAVALNAGDYSVGVIAHDYTDPDDLAAPSMTITNVGDGGTAPPGSFSTNNGPFQRHLAGPSANGGDEISWFEGRITEMHWLTSDGTTLTREQVFPIDGTEQFRDFAGRSATWIFDGTDFWHLSYILSTSPGKLLLTRFVPTAVGDPYDYEKFEITLDDSALQTKLLASGGPFILSVTDDAFFVQMTSLGDFGNVKYIKVSKDGTAYQLINISGNATVFDLAGHNVPNIAQLPDERYRISDPIYSGNGYTVGTYDLLCTGATNQAHCYTRKRTRVPRPNDHGNRITTDGDFRETTDEDRRIWKRTQA